MRDFSNKIKIIWSDLSQWRRNHIPDNTFIFILAFMVGILSGLGASCLRVLISLVTKILISHLEVSHAGYIFLCLPLIGILLTACYSRFIAHDDLSHGTDKIINLIKQRKFNIKRNITYAPIIGCSLTLGFGGSAGAEGPIAYSGAAIGSNIGQMFRVPPRFMMMLIGCGAAGAISGIYKAPIGGMLYALEVLKVEMSTVSVVAMMMTCLISAMVSYSLSGFNVDVRFDQLYPFESSMIPSVIIMGIFCGLYSFYYFGIMRYIDSKLKMFKNHWVKNIIAGICLSGFIFLFPTLYGEGFDSMTKVLADNVTSITYSSLYYEHHGHTLTLILVLAGIILAKAICAGLTNSGGGVSGDFTPTLFAGCMTGLLFAMASNYIFGTKLDAANFALMGMAGVMAGVIRAPLMAIFLTTELTGNLGLLVPITITASLSFCIVKICMKEPFFQSQYTSANLDKPIVDEGVSPLNNVEEPDGKN
ncbi:MAG: chloride channel protein [Muribaculum sp.]|nr:chloride channel protein [Muribaculum sp.]